MQQTSFNVYVQILFRIIDKQMGSIVHEQTIEYQLND